MRRWRTSAILVTLAVAALGSCGIARAAGPALPSQDPFYAPPPNFASTAPGTILRSRSVPIVVGGLPTGMTGTQVLYRTTGELRQPTVTVATIIRPAVTVGAPKLVSYQTFYDGLGPECQPSYLLQGGNSGYTTEQLDNTIITTYIEHGYTIVTSDYEGQTNDYGAGQESGYNTLDAIRAAEKQMGLPASTAVAMLGYSGGSIATEWARELAPAYSPELNIVGSAAGGVPVNYVNNMKYINGSNDWSGVIPAVFLGLARGFHLDLNRYLSPYGEQLVNQVKGECINNFLGAYPGLTIQKILKPQYADVTKVPAFVRIFNEMLMSTSGIPKDPVFFGNGNADGTGDGVMVAADVKALAHFECQHGIPVQFSQYNGDNHDEAAVPFESTSYAWITARLAGAPAPNDCSSIGSGNSLAPLPTPRAKTSSRTTLHARFAGVRRHRHAIALRVWTTHGTLRHLVIELLRGRRVLAKARVAAVGGRAHTLVLRARRRLAHRGRYTIVVLRARHTIVSQRVGIR